MKKVLTALACCCLYLQTASFAMASERPLDLASLKIGQAGDLKLSCHEISQEISILEDLIVYAKEIQNDTELTNTGIAVGKAVGSYLVGSLAGGIGILAAGYLVSEATDDKAENAEALEDAAEKRRSFMAGIYNAKGCMGPLELTAIEPAAGADKEPLLQPRRRDSYKFNN